MSRRKAALPEAKTTKTNLRTLHADRVRGLSRAKRKQDSARIVARLGAMKEFAAAGVILFYWPVGRLGEVDFRPAIRAALKAGKVVCLPRIEGKTRRMTARRVRSLTRDMEVDPARPKLKLRQPVEGADRVSAKGLDLIIVPGVAFDRAGNRLGRGGGFYDRFLFGLPSDRPLRVAVAFDEQINEEVVAEPHDQRVNVIVTPSGIIRAGRRARD